MSEPEQQQEVAAETSLGPAEAGAMLAAARAGSGMSIEDAAGRLRLGIRQLQALEAGDSAALPDATFVRGFIRNYARLLRIDPEPLLRAYRSDSATAHHSITLASENITIAGRDNKAWQPYALAGLLVALALAGWVLFIDAGSPQRHSPPPGPSQPELARPLVVPAPEPSQPVAEAPASEPMPAEQAAPVAAPPALARLKATFDGEAWMSVIDGAGKEIYKKTRPAGSEEIIEGVPPLQVVVGNVAETRLTYNDQPVDLAPHASANVARLTLE